MVRKVIWTQRAQNNRKEILNYWRIRNKSNLYSKKLNELFKIAIVLIKQYPQIGKLTDDKHARVKIVRDYHIVYEANETSIYILAIWDIRRDPQKFDKEF